MSQDILLTLIDADPGQPRRNFDPVALAELAQSIAANGQAVPVLLRPGADGRYIIVHGERRCRAVQSLGWFAIRAEVRDMTPEDARWLALAENIQRADLSPIEEADAYRAALADGITQTELGRRLGKSQSYIATKLRLLRLPGEVRQAVDSGAITEGHAKQLLRLTGEAEQTDLTRRAVAADWTVQRLKLEVDTALTPPGPDYEVHPFGQIFPMVDQNELARIADSIRDIGLIEPITLYEGKILDGKIRYAACKAAGVKPRFRVFPDNFPNRGGSAIDYVLSANLYRQNFTADQRAMAGAKLLEGFAADGIAKAGELRDQLDKATTVGETVDVIRAAADLQTDLAEVTLHCERRVGQLLSELKENATGEVRGD